MLIVQKFGGTSVADAKRIENVARRITDTYKEGNDVVVVVSAQGDTTDELLEKAAEVNPKASKRELDMLLTAGEQMSAALLAMAIQKLGFPAVSLLGWQIGMKTNASIPSSPDITSLWSPVFRGSTNTTILRPSDGAAPIPRRWQSRLF